MNSTPQRRVGLPVVVLAAVVLAAVAALVVTLLWREPAPPIDAGPTTSGAPADSGGQGRAAAAAPPQPDPAGARTSVAAPPPATAGFSSQLDDGEPEVAPARDGLVFCLQHHNGAIAADVPITIRWRKGFGLYGTDRGTTDAAGTFASTVQSTDQIEGLHVEHPRLGELSRWDDLLPSAADPRRVLLVLPQLAPLRLVIRDLEGRGVAGAKAMVGSLPDDPTPRAYSLMPDEMEVEADALGDATIDVPVGACVVHAEADGFASLQTPTILVGPDGASARITMLDTSARQEVEVRVTLPPGIDAEPAVGGFSLPLPAAVAERLGAGVEQEQRKFAGRADGGRWFVAVDPLPWRLVVRAEGCAAGIVDLPGYRALVQVNLERMAPVVQQPKARLLVRVELPDGTPTYATIRVHETPDLVYGPDHSTDNEGRFEQLREPSGRVCVSAVKHQYARAISPAIELTPGDHEVVLRLREPASVRGRVVDSAGRPIQARVALRRPAEGLRGLGDDVPAILQNQPTSDWLGTSTDGKFEFGDLYPGLHELYASPEDGGQWPARARAMPGDDVTLVLGQGLDDLCLLTVTVLDDATGAPLARCDVKHLGDTNDQGIVRRAMPVQELSLQCWAKDHVVTPSGPHALQRGPQSIVIRVPLSRAVFLRVLDGGGAPVERAEVFVLGDEDDEPYDLMDAHGNYAGVRELTDRLGRTELRGLPDGPLRLRVVIDEVPHVVDMPAAAGRDAAFEVRIAR